MRINQENKSLDMEIRDINFILPPYVRSYQFYCKGEAPEKIVFPMFPSVDIVGEDREIHPMPIEWISPESPAAKELAEDGAEISAVTPEHEAELDKKDEEIIALRKQIADLTTPPSTRALEEKATCARCKGPIEEGVESDICGTCADTLRDEAAAQAAEPALTPGPEDITRQQEEDALAEQEAAWAAEAEAEAVAKQAEAEAEAKPAESPAKAAFAKPIEGADTITGPPEVLVRQPKQPPGGDIGPGSPLSDMGPRSVKDQIRTAKDLIEEPEVDESAEQPFEKEVSRDESGKPIVEDKPDAPD